MGFRLTPQPVRTPKVPQLPGGTMKGGAKDMSPVSSGLPSKYKSAKETNFTDMARAMAAGVA